jgi:hypothetical protein
MGGGADPRHAAAEDEEVDLTPGLAREWLHRPSCDLMMI